MLGVINLLSLTVWETALHQKRPYLDLIDGINAIKHIIFHKLVPGIYNCATNTSSVQEIVDIIKELKPNIEVKKVKSSIMNDLSYGINTKKFIDTGFVFTGDLRRAIKETMSLFKGVNN